MRVYTLIRIVLTGLVGATLTGAPVEGSSVTGFSVGDGDGVGSDEGDFVGNLVGCGKTRQWIESGIRHHRNSLFFTH